MAAACIVLNGASCSGKSSIAAALQERWPRPLQSTGIDTFLASQSERFFAIDVTLTDGVSWVPTTVDGMPAFDIVPGELGLGMIRASHSFWSSCVEAGLDQVIDDVWVIPEQPTWLERALSRALPRTKSPPAVPMTSSIPLALVSVMTSGAPVTALLTLAV